MSNKELERSRKTTHVLLMIIILLLIVLIIGVYGLIANAPATQDGSVIVQLG